MDRFTLGASAAETSVPWRKLRLRLGDLDAIRWRAKGLFRVIFPVPVVLKRFAALRHVLIFGMIMLSPLPCYRAGKTFSRALFPVVSRIRQRQYSSLVRAAFFPAGVTCACCLRAAAVSP